MNTQTTNIDINQIKQNFTDKGINVVIVQNKEEALEYLKMSIPEHSSVMSGSSTTLNQIGFTEHLKDQTKWNNLHSEILQEEDMAKQNDLRRHSQTADYFLGSANALTKDGKIVAVDATGSRVGAYAFASRRLIIVAGTNKIVENLDEAFKRIQEYVFPLENKRAQEAYGVNSTFGKWVIIDRETTPQRTTLVLVNQELGY